MVVQPYQANVATYRTAVRAKANEMCTKIDAAVDVDALADLYLPTFNQRQTDFGEWPTLGS